MSKKIDPLLWKSIKIRLIFVIIGILLIFFYVSYKIFSVYFLESEEYIRDANRFHNSNIKINVKRGNIYDVNGKKLAISIPAKTLYARPRAINQKDKAVKVLSEFFKLDYTVVFRKLFSKKKNFLYIKRMMSEEDAKSLKNKLKENKITGFGFETESKRVYPQESLAAQLIGFVGADSRGLYGVEKALDFKLKFKGEKRKVLKNAKHKIIEFKNKDFSDIMGVYNEVELSINSFIQYFVEEELKKGVEEFGVKRGVAIVMNPNTGEVLAAAQYPTFNPNKYKEYSSKLWKPYYLSMVYEPGSTFKTFSIALALKKGVITPNTKFDCESGSMKVGRFIIHDSHPHDILSVKDILVKSSNIGTVKIIEKVESKDFYDFVKDLHFGQRYKINVPGQERGLVKRLKRWRKVEVANISFGQGIGVTPLQLINAFSAMINGGNLMKPIFIKKIMDEDGKIVKENKPEILKKIISSDISKKLRYMLKEVVSSEGTAPRAGIYGIEIGGKTGTAQKIDPTKRRYSDKRIASFIGFFPVKKPKYVILVIMDEPTVSSYGGVVAAPVFKNIATRILKYYHKAPKGIELDDLNLNLPELETNIKLLESVLAIERRLGIKKVENKKIDTNKVKMPNLIGLNIRDALLALEKNNLNFEVIGKGTIYKTIPKENSLINKNENIKIFMKEIY